jgi:hypothetical protein
MITNPRGPSAVMEVWVTFALTKLTKPTFHAVNTSVATITIIALTCMNLGNNKCTNGMPTTTKVVVLIAA